MLDSFGKPVFISDTVVYFDHTINTFSKATVKDILYDKEYGALKVTVKHRKDDFFLYPGQFIVYKD